MCKCVLLAFDHLTLTLPIRKPVLVEAPIDVSRSAQIRDIEASFPTSVDQPLDLTLLTHPTKPGLTAVASYEVLPDGDLWANSYDIFRFSERPGERPADVSKHSKSSFPS